MFASVDWGSQMDVTIVWGSHSYHEDHKRQATRRGYLLFCSRTNKTDSHCEERSERPPIIGDAGTVTLEHRRTLAVEQRQRWSSDNAGTATTLEQRQRWNSDNAGTATPNVQIELLDTLRQ